MGRRLTPKLISGSALKIFRPAISTKNMVYLFVGNKSYKYPWEKSRVIYIGTSSRGIKRITESVANRGKVLSEHGFKEFEVRIVVCPKRQKVSTWKLLESAFLIVFREKFGGIPFLNKKGGKLKERGEWLYFSKVTIRKILDELDADND